MSRLIAIFQNLNAAVLGIIFAVVTVLGMVIFFLAKMGFKAKYVLLALGALLLICLIIGLFYGIWLFIKKKRANNLENEIGKDAASMKHQRQQVKYAVQSLREQWGKAQQTLKAHKIKIYDMPWILLIGEPQSGKTTTLRESGLDFPLGKEALSGSGGTVNCDWWFTNDAVILDTAGRFTMPVDTAPDKEEWHAFLNLLARYRPRCPINGVVVTIPATSLFSDPPEVIKEKAAKIQSKLHELVKVLGVEFPVYIMVSKLDLVYGFAEFCASLSTNERLQILGWNRKNISSGDFNQQEFNIFYSAMVSRLHAWALRRIRDIHSGSEVDRIYAFPSEFNRLRSSLSSYLGLIFKQDRFGVPLLLRGCFFSSGLQEGRSIARALFDTTESPSSTLMAEFAKSFVKSRAYFINVFYRKVFMERWLVRRAGKATQYETTLRIVAGCIAVLIFLGAGSLLYFGHRNLTRVVRPLEAKVLKAEKILISDSDYEVNEIIEIVDALESGRQKFAEQGTMRFLKSGADTIGLDIGRIEDMLVEQKLVSMLIDAAGRKFVSPESISSPDAKRMLHKAMMQYVGYLSGEPLTQEAIGTILDYVFWQNDSLASARREEIERILDSYPYGERPESSTRTINNAIVYLQEGIDNLKGFWTTYYVGKWNEQNELFSSINSSYQQILDASTLRGNTRVKEAMSGSLDKLNDSIESLIANGEKNLVWDAALAEECNSDYLELKRALIKPGVENFNRLATVVNSDSMVCRTLNQGVGVDWVASLDKNSHILLRDGTINPTLLEVPMAIQLALDFGPLFEPEQRRKIKSEPGDILSLLDYWHQTWTDSSNKSFENIKTVLDPVDTKAWKKEQLNNILTNYLKYVIWQAEYEAVLAVVENVFQKDVRFARAGSLADKYADIQSIYEWFKARQPGGANRQMLQEMQKLMRKKVSGAFYKEWHAFQDNWQKVFGDRFPFGNPEKWTVGETSDAGLKTITYRISSYDDLHRFYFAPDIGFEIFMTRTGLSSIVTEEKSDNKYYFMSEEQKEVISRLGAWRNFLFDQNGRAKSHKVEISIVTGDDVGSQDAASQFTVIDFNGLENETGRDLRLRFSGSRYKEGIAIWDGDSAPEISIECKNEETGEESTYKVTGGSLVLPVMLIDLGSRDDRIRLSDWDLVLAMPLPEVDTTYGYPDGANRFSQAVPAHKRGQVNVQLKVKWDEMMPENIQWPVK